MKHRSTKKFGPFSCAFRQPGAASHCRFIHGYGLVFQVDFGADVLDDNGWVIDFGGLKGLKATLEEMFDHKLVVAARDPLMSQLVDLYNAGGCDLAVFTKVGIEYFAEVVFYQAAREIERMGHGDRVTVIKVECWEHPTNSASYQPGCVP